MSLSTVEGDLLQHLLESSFADSPAEARARSYALDRVGLIKGSVPAGTPLMMLKAVPLGATVTDVYSDDLREYLRSNPTSLSHRGVRPAATHFGLVVGDYSPDYLHILEVHRLGFLLLAKALYVHVDESDPSGPATIITEEDFVDIGAFCSILHEVRRWMAPPSGFLLRLTLWDLRRPHLPPRGVPRRSAVSLTSGNHKLPEIRVTSDEELSPIGAELRRSLARGLGHLDDPYRPES